MSKFKLIEGLGNSTNVVDITRIRELDKMIKPIEHTLNNKGLVTYAYHYARTSSARRAEDLLDRLKPGYFLDDIYKDLYHALFCWSAYQATDRSNPELYKESEYFLVVKNSLDMFKHLSFKEKKNFVVFYQDHLKKIKFTNTH